MIELINTVKNFDGSPVLNNVNLTINKGTAFGLLGSNGAGKSTILRLLCGVYKSDGGKVLIDGQEVFDNNAVKERVFFINDETVQFAEFTLIELKDFYKKFYPKFSEEIFNNLRNTINLPTDKKIAAFSKGMKRQAIVIIGLACQTDYLLLDEAFDGLDPTMRIIVKRMLVDAMVDRQLTTVISSHNLKEINEVCDTVALLHKGNIVFSRELDSVKSSVHKLQTAFPAAPDGSPADFSPSDFPNLDILHFEKTQSVYHIILRGDADEIKSAFADKNPLIFDIVPLTLEEIFIYEMEVLGYDSNGLKDPEQ